MNTAFALLLLSAAYFPPPESEGGWRSGAAEAGFDRARLEEAWRYCLRFEGPHSVLIIRNGWIAAEWRNFEDPRSIASCTKSLTGVALAKLFTSGRLTPDDFAWRHLYVRLWDAGMLDHSQPGHGRGAAGLAKGFEFEPGFLSGILAAGR